MTEALQSGLDFGQAPDHGGGPPSAEAVVSVTPDYGESISRATGGASMALPPPSKAIAEAKRGAQPNTASPVLSEQLLSAHSAALDSAAAVSNGHGGADLNTSPGAGGGMRLPAGVPKVSEGQGLFDDDEEEEEGFGSPTADLRAPSPLKLSPASSRRASGTL